MNFELNNGLRVKFVRRTDARGSADIIYVIWPIGHPAWQFYIAPISPEIIMCDDDVCLAANVKRA